MAGLGRPARLDRDGLVRNGSWVAGSGVELLAESGGRLQGRFLMQPGPAGPPSREQLLVAVALADQAGAALAPHYPVAS